MMRSFIVFFWVGLWTGCAPDPGVLSSDERDGGMTQTDGGPVPGFAEATDEEIESFCFKTISQVTDLDWLGEQVGVQGEFLRRAWCHGLVAQSLGEVEEDAIAVCEDRVAGCLETAAMVFSVQENALLDCERHLKEARDAECMNPISDFKDCLADSYPQGFSLGLERDELQSLADASCVDLLTDPAPMGRAPQPPPSCLRLEARCAVFSMD